MLTITVRDMQPSAGVHALSRHCCLVWTMLQPNNNRIMVSTSLFCSHPKQRLCDNGLVKLDILKVNILSSTIVHARGSVIVVAQPPILLPSDSYKFPHRPGEGEPLPRRAPLPPV